MAFSQEVRFKIGGDTSALRASFSQATSMAESAGKQMQKSLSQLDKITSARGLLEFRRKVAFEEANTVGKIKITTEKLASLSYQISQTEKGTTKQKNLQLQMDKERFRLTQLRKQQAAENLTQQPGGGGEPEEEKGRTGLGMRQLAFRAIGGAITFALERVISYNASRVRVAESQAESRAAGVASLRSTFAQIGGLTGQLRQGRATGEDLERDRQFYENRRNFLSTGAQGALSKIAPGELERTEKTIEDINAKIQQQHNANQLIERDLMKQRALMDSILGRTGGSTPGQGNSFTVAAGRQSGSLVAIERAQRRGELSELRRAQIEQRRLEKVAEAERKFGTPESKRAAQQAVEAQRIEVAGARQRARQQLLDVNQQLAQEAAGGRTFANGRARPLSETERIARRAQQFRQRAQNAALTGAGADAAHFLQSAISDEATVSNRLSAATAGVSRKDVGDATSIKPEILRSNQLLEAIKNSLENVDLD